MRRKWFRLLSCLLLLSLLAGCSSIAPKEKTLILSEKAEETPANDAEDPSALSFAVKKITNLPLDKLNPTGIHPDVTRAVIGWMDEDNLLAMSVQKVEVGGGEDEAVEQPTERVITQFVRINYQYGFYDPILTLADVEAECFDVSADRSLAAYVAGNTLGVYSLRSGALVQMLQRPVLASRVTFAKDRNDLYFTNAGDDKLLERMDVASGSVEGVLSGKSFRVLAAEGENLLVCTQSDGNQQIGFYDGERFSEKLIDGESRANSCCILPSGEGLAAYDGDLYRLSSDGAELAGEDITAFDLGSDGMHIAFACRNSDGTVDIRIGYWGGRGIINDKLTYKDIGVNVNAMFFSPDLDKLYLQGRDETGALVAYTFEFQ